MKYKEIDKRRTKRKRKMTAMIRKSESSTYTTEKMIQMKHNKQDKARPTETPQTRKNKVSNTEDGMRMHLNSDEYFWVTIRTISHLRPEGREDRKSIKGVPEYMTKFKENNFRENQSTEDDPSVKRETEPTKEDPHSNGNCPTGEHT